MRLFPRLVLPPCPGSPRTTAKPAFPTKPDEVDEALALLQSVFPGTTLVSVGPKADHIDDVRPDGSRHAVPWPAWMAVILRYNFRRGLPPSKAAPSYLHKWAPWRRPPKAK